MADPTTGVRPILFVHQGQDWIRGSERCLLDLIEHLDRTRYRPIVWCNAPTLARSAEALGAHVHLAPTSPKDDRWPPLVGDLARTASRLVREHGVRLIHANDITPLPALIATARRGRIPLLAHIHLIPTPVERRWAFLHQATLVVGVSRASVDGLVAEGMPPERVRVIYNGVDVARFTRVPPTDLRQELGIAPGAVSVTAVASLIHRKGLDVAIRAVARLRATGRDIHLILCGDGDAEGELRALAAELGVASATHFLGVRTDVGDVLRGASDIVVSAARLEAFPLNLLEAGACGLPVVVSDIPPHREGVIDGATGLIAETDDSASFATAIARLADDPTLRRTMGAQARQNVEANYTLERWIRDMHRTYNELSARPQRTLGWFGGSTWPHVYTAWMREAVERRLKRRAL